MNFNSLRKEILSKNASVSELTSDFFSRIEKINPQINAYICTTKDIAKVQAQRVDEIIQKDQHLPLLGGIPIAIKDNICTKGVVTSCSSKMLKNLLPHMNLLLRVNYGSLGLFS